MQNIHPFVTHNLTMKEGETYRNKSGTLRTLRRKNEFLCIFSQEKIAKRGKRFRQKTFFSECGLTSQNVDNLGVYDTNTLMAYFHRKRGKDFDNPRRDPKRLSII